METIKLSNRLAAIASYVEHGAAVADIGTDHGYLPVYLMQTGTASYMLASDIAAGPLGAARRNAEACGMAQCIEFVNAPGLEGVCLQEIDTVIIAGMGGETIAEIINAADFPVGKSFRLILQPQTKLAHLCRSITGFYLKTASLVRDAGRIYAVLAYESGTPDFTRDDGYCEFLSVLRKNGDKLFAGYLESLILKETRILQALGSSHGAEADLHKSELRLLRGFLMNTEGT